MATSFDVSSFRPDETPEMGFQAYEKFDDPRSIRASVEADFLADRVVNPDLEYPLLDEKELDRGIHNLQAIMDSCDEFFDDPMLADAAYSSAAYRMAEMYWLKEAKRLDRYSRGKQNEVVDAKQQQSAMRYQAANEMLYGVPDPDISQRVINEIIAQATEKSLHPSVATIRSQLLFGKYVPIDDANKVIHMPELRKVGEERLPQGLEKKLAPLAEALEAEFPFVFETVRSYWDMIVAPRSLQEGVKAEFTREDMKIIFDTVHTEYDPDNRAGVSVVIHPGSTQLAWDTPSMSVRIGSRRKAIDNPEEMIGKVIHEYGHALRAINGLKTDFPVLGTGLFTEAGEGESADSLTFEEGFLSLCEMAIGKQSGKWEGEHLSRHLANASSYRKLSYRQVFEQNWRARLLVDMPADTELTDEKLAYYRKQAQISTRRIRRGTPTQNGVKGHVVTYNKDLAYLSGKLKALEYLDVHDFDPAIIHRLFAGKFDPTNRIQDQIVDKVWSPDLK